MRWVQVAQIDGQVAQTVLPSGHLAQITSSYLIRTSQRSHRPTIVASSALATGIVPLTIGGNLDQQDSSPGADLSTWTVGLCQLSADRLLMNFGLSGIGVVAYTFNIGLKACLFSAFSIRRSCRSAQNLYASVPPMLLVVCYGDIR